MCLFSVIIPTCNRHEVLMHCLKCVAPSKQEKITLFNEISTSPKDENINEYEVIVTDDGSLSNAQLMLKEMYPWARWVSGPKRGPAANRNYGAEKATGDWLVFVDDDCLPKATFLDAYACAAAEGNCFVLEGVTLPQGDREAADLECPVNIRGGHLWSCNFAIKRSLFKDLGGFDECFPGPFMEDTDMQTRIFKSGHAPVFVPEAIVGHPWRPRRGFNFLPYQARSIAYYVNKHPEYQKCFSLLSLIKRAVSAAIRDFPKNFASYRGKGAWRMLALELVLVSLLFKYLKCSPKIGVPKI